MTLIIARDTERPASKAPHHPMRPSGGKDRGLAEELDLELDLDRVVYDPEYRARMRDALNRANKTAERH